MSFDTSDVASKIAPQLPKVQTPNPIETVGSLAQLQNSLNENRFFQARNLAGQYLQASLGPNGEPDPNVFSSLIQGDNRTAPFAPQILESMQAIRQGGTAVSQAKTNLATSQLQNLRNDDANAYAAAYTSAKTANPDADPSVWDSAGKKASVAYLTRGASLGRYSPDQVSQYLGDGQFDTSRAAIISGDAGPGAQTALTGNIVQVAMPQGTQSLNVSPYTGEVNKVGGNASFIANKLSKKDLSEPIDILNPDGSKTRHILGDYLDEDSGWKPGVTPPLIDAGPLTNTARAALGSAYGPKIAEFESEAAAAPQTKALIDQMRNASQQFATGPHSAFWQKMGELGAEYGIHVPGFDPNNDKTAQSEVFGKILPDIIRQQAVRLGMNETDTGRQIAALSAPAQGLTAEGINKILGIVEGNTDALIAQGKVWSEQKAKRGEGVFGNFRMEFPREVPPTIFQSQYMSPAELQEMQKDWTPQQKSDWNARRDLAKKHGWLPNAQ